MSASSDEIPLSLSLPRPPTGIAGVRSSTIKTRKMNLPLRAPVATVLLESFQVGSLALGRHAAINPNVSATADPEQNESK